MRALLLLVVACGGGAKEPPKPELIAAKQLQPQQTAVRDGYVYWSEYGTVGGGNDQFVSGAIKRAKIGGGEIEIIHPNAGHPTQVVFAADAIYWYDNASHTLVRAPFSGDRTEWKTESKVLDVVGGVPYWMRKLPVGTLRYELVKGSAAEPEVVATGFEEGTMPTGMVATDKAIHVALFKDAGQGSVVRVDGDQVRVIATRQGVISGMAMRGDRVVWTTCKEDALLEAPDAAEGVPKVIAKFPAKSCPSDVVVDGKDIYVATSMDGNVWRVRDGKPTKLGNGDGFAAGLSLDATHIYWANNGSAGDILRAAR